MLIRTIRNNRCWLPLVLMEPRMWQASEIIRRIGTVWRVKDDAIMHEPLPQRWVDLIHYLDEKERREKGHQRRRHQQPN